MLKFTIGADISKDKINFALRLLNYYLLEKEVENTTSALNKFIKEVQSLVKSIKPKKPYNSFQSHGFCLAYACFDSWHSHGIAYS